MATLKASLMSSFEQHGMDKFMSAGGCGGEYNNKSDEQQARRNVLSNAGKSKSRFLWGPSHSRDSEDEEQSNSVAAIQTNSGNNHTESTKEETCSSADKSPSTPRLVEASSASPSPPTSRRNTDSPRKSPIGRFLETAAAAVEEFMSTPTSSQKQSKPEALGEHNDNDDKSPPENERTLKLEHHANLIAEAICIPCHDIMTMSRPPVNKDGPEEDGNSTLTTRVDDKEEDAVIKGVQSRMVDMRGMSSPNVITPEKRNGSFGSNTPVERRRKRHEERLPRSSAASVKPREEVEINPTSGKASVHMVSPTVAPNDENPSPSAPEKPLPLQTFEVMSDEALDLDRSISELTMKSSYGEATEKLAENRRMAYYAVGKHSNNKSGARGGNRRCYFSGKLILSGAPFYAGSVQQGLRTLVVFCLPSALGLPKGEIPEGVRRQDSRMSQTGGSLASRASEGDLKGYLPSTMLGREQSKESLGVRASPRRARSTGSSSTSKGGIIRNRVRTSSRDMSQGSATSISRLSSSDDVSFNTEDDLDSNWGLDRDYLLQVLPEPSDELLHEMEVLYPEQYETLPVQVRSPHCWRLFIKFCFFSGLPIAEGEMHYKVRDEIAMEEYAEEINLSHDVMEAVNGASAEILRLPNLKTFRYLRKHYTQQSGKLSDAVFTRKSWEMVRPEI